MEIFWILLFLLSPVVFGFFAWGCGKKNPAVSQMVAIGGTAVSAVLSVVLLFLFRDGTEIVAGPFLGDAFSFSFGRFRGIYCAVISFGWLLAGLFSVQYFQKHGNKSRFWFFYLLTLTGTLGVFLAGDLVTLFVFFELMSFSSFVWVIHDENTSAFRASRTYMTVTVISGMCLLMGLFLLYHALGTLSVSALPAALLVSSRQHLLFPAGIFLLIGFGAKAGAFPLHIWLPKAHSVSPAPASALLSGLLTKAGIFGLLLMTVSLFRGDFYWGYTLMILGYITMLLGGVRGIFSCQLKETLAWSSVSQLGFILIGCSLVGLMGEHGGMAASGTVLYMLNHSTVKIVLFLCAGVVVANLNKLDLNEIKGIGRGHPFFMLLFLFGACSLCGIPPFAGYTGKTLLHESILEYGELAASQGVFFPTKAAEILFLIGGGCTVAYMAKLFAVLFLDLPPEKQIEKRRLMTPLSFSSIALPAAALLIFGLFSSQTLGLAVSCLPFFSVDFHENVNFFSLENLSGAMISAAIGALVYFLVIRNILYRKTETGKKYLALWPEWLDLETVFYWPVGRSLGFLLTAVCRIVYSLPDWIVLFFSKVFFSPSKPKETAESGDSLAHLVGSVADGVLSFSDRHIRHQNPRKRDLELRLARVHSAFSNTTRRIILNFSFALLMACIGICLTLIYILFFSR